MSPNNTMEENFSWSIRSLTVVAEHSEYRRMLQRGIGNGLLTAHGRCYSLDRQEPGTDTILCPAFRSSKNSHQDPGGPDMLCDNIALVNKLDNLPANSFLWCAKDPLLMHLAHCLHFFLTKLDILQQAQHVCGAVNTVAVVLLRNQLASPLQDKIPSAPVDMLLLHRF